MAAHMFWRLTDSVTCCRAGGRFILLDIDRDRYFALPSGQDRRFADWLESDHPQSGIGGSVLAASGVRIVAGTDPLPCRVEMPAPIDASPVACPGFSCAGLAGVGLAVLKARHEVQNRNLGAVLRARTRPGHAPSPAMLAARARRLAMFRQVRSFVPVARVCLHDCLALFDWLGGAESGATLVLGISAFPFAAHSWLQADGRTIDDYPICPSRYQPIFTLP